MKPFKTLLAAVVLAAACALPAFAQGAKVGALEIHHPHSPATLPGAPVGVGWLTIVNTGTEADRLVSVSSPIAADSQIHEMAMDGEVMKMRQLTDGLEIPAGATVELKKGGYHLMFMKLKQPMTDGDMVKATLVFEKAGPVDVEFAVEAMGSEMKDHMKEDSNDAHKDHKGHKS